MKINISIDEKLLERIDAAAKQKYMSRSGFIACAAAEYLDQKMVLGYMPEILKAAEVLQEK